jgi:hypothetical protein
MPSHIFTRLGLWDDSIHANLAAREAAHQQGDTGEELHAMDYLVYADLQMGRNPDAAQVIQQLTNMPKLDQADFKIAYAYTAMPVRYALERRKELLRTLPQSRSGLAGSDSLAADELRKPAKNLLN